MKKWEYKIREFLRINHAVAKELREIGSDGWELTAVIKQGYAYKFIFKREVLEVTESKEQQP